MITLNIKISDEVSYSIKVPANVDAGEFQEVMKRMRAVFNVSKKINPTEEPIVAPKIISKKPTNKKNIRRNSNPVMALDKEKRAKIIEVYNKVGVNGLAEFLENQMGLEKRAPHWYHTVIYYLRKKAANNE